MFGLGPPELVIILVIALIIFGPRRLPEMGAAIGKSIREFKKSTREIADDISVAKEIEDVKKDMNPVASAEPEKEIAASRD